jgi:hypothetical protein
MVESLSGTDQLSIVTYQDGVSTDLPLTPQNEEGKVLKFATIFDVNVILEYSQSSYNSYNLWWVYKSWGWPCARRERAGQKSAY